MSNATFVIAALEDAKKFYTLRSIRKSLLALSFALLLSFGAFAQGQSPVQANEPKTMLTGVVYDINGAVVVDTLIVALRAFIRLSFRWLSMQYRPAQPGFALHV
jgi:hypothetical protein